MVEAQSDRPVQQPERISAQQQKRFNELHAGIVGKLKPGDSIIVTTNNPRYRVPRYLSLNETGGWSSCVGNRMDGARFPIEPEESAKLITLLIEYAHINSPLFDEMVKDGTFDTFDDEAYWKYLKESKELDESVKQNPYPIAEKFLGDMERSLKKLSGEEET